jgi:hypothetical protein
MMTLGRTRSVHQPSPVGVAGYALAATICFALVIAVIVAGSAAEPAARLVVGAIFLGAGVIFTAHAVTIARTRVEICDGGLRHIGWSEREVLWRDVARARVAILRGYRRALFVDTGVGRLTISRRVKGFNQIVHSLAQHVR